MFHKVGDRWVHSLSFGAGPRTLVGVAGSFANWEIWAPTFERLSPRWRVVGFDHDGVGQTKVPLDGITHERRVETLLSVLDAHGVDRCVVAGDSSNSTLAVEAAVRQPGRVEGVVIVNGRLSGFDTAEARRFADGLRSHFEKTLEFFVGVVFPEPESDHLKRWLADIIMRTGPAAAARIVESYFDLDLDALGRELAVPAMVLHTDQDFVAGTLDDAAATAKTIGGELHVIEGAGHLPLLSRPDAVADALDDFMRRA